MKKLVLLIIGICLYCVSNAESDKIYRHNGEIITGKVLKVTEFSVNFTYLGEDAENILGKYAIEKIVFGQSNRVQEITEKIVVNDKKDWEKVVILEDVEFIAGLKKVAEIRGKTSFINFHTANTGDKKALKLLKEEAAQNGAPFVLMQAEKSSVGKNSNQLGGSQEVKKGFCYKY